MAYRKQAWDPQKAEADKERLTAMIQAGVEAIVSGDQWKTWATRQAQFHSYSFGNVLLILEQCPHATAVAGYQAWKNIGTTTDPITGEVHPGHQVRRGETGIRILAPVTKRQVSWTPDDPFSWVTLDRGSKPAPGQAVRSKMVGVRSTVVFDVSQTDGDPLPVRAPATLLEGEAPTGAREFLTSQIEARGFTASMVPSAAELDGANGVTDYVSGTVQVREDMSAAHQVKTLAHELGHVLMHHPDDTRSEHRGIQEVQAETFAFMVADQYGMDTSGYTFPYVAGWAESVLGQEAAPEAYTELVGQQMKIIADAARPVLEGIAGPSLAQQAAVKEVGIQEERLSRDTARLSMDVGVPITRISRSTADPVSVSRVVSPVSSERRSRGR